MTVSGGCTSIAEHARIQKKNSVGVQGIIVFAGKGEGGGGRGGAGWGVGFRGLFSVILL